MLLPAYDLSFYEFDDERDTKIYDVLLCDLVHGKPPFKPLYIGLGASGGTYLKDIFYLNTFNVSEYIRAIENEMMPIALSLDLSENMQMAWWLYWRVYETRFKRSDFEKRFGKKFNEIYGKYIKLFSFFGLIKKDDGDRIVLTDRGTYWLHAIEDLFSLNYVGKLWGTSKQEPWPERVDL